MDDASKMGDGSNDDNRRSIEAMQEEHETTNCHLAKLEDDDEKSALKSDLRLAGAEKAQLEQDKEGLTEQQDIQIQMDDVQDAAVSTEADAALHDIAEAIEAVQQEAVVTVEAYRASAEGQLLEQHAKGLIADATQRLQELSQSPAGAAATEQVQSQIAALEAQLSHGQDRLRQFYTSDNAKQLQAMAKDVGSQLEVFKDFIQGASSQDPEEALAKFHDFLHGVEENVTRAAAIGMIVKARLGKVEQAVRLAVVREAEQGFQDVVQVWQKEQGIEVKKPNPDDIVGVLGPLFLTFDRSVNVIGLIHGPLMLIAIGVCAYVDHIAHKDTNTCDEDNLNQWFVVRAVVEVLLIIVRCVVEYRYRDWRAKQDAAEATVMTFTAAADDPRDAPHVYSMEEVFTPRTSAALGDTVSELRNSKEKLDALAANGLLALRIHDEITGCPLYRLSELSLPAVLAWNLYGMVLASRVYCDDACGSTAMAELLYYYSLIFVATFFVDLIVLAGWILSLVLMSENFEEYLRGVCTDIDASNGSFPICTFDFDKIVMRNKDATRLSALKKQRQRIESQLKASDQEVRSLRQRLKDLDHDLQQAEQEAEASESERLIHIHEWEERHAHEKEEEAEQAVVRT